MIEITYKEKSNDIGQVIVTWGKDRATAPGPFDTDVVISEATIFLDLQKAAYDITNYVEKKRVGDEGKKAVRHYGMVLPMTLIAGAADGALEHVLADLINAFFPLSFHSDIHINVLHPGATKLKRVADAVRLMNRVQEARLLAMIPANVASPAYMTAFVQKLFAKVADISIKVVKGDDLKKRGFGLIYSVGASASAQNAPALVVVERKPKRVVRGQKTICLLGKGITFDSGGLAIKNDKGMVDMKYDKLGAVYSMYAMLELIHKDASNHYVCIMPFAENAVSENSTRPGDVIKSYLGPTVEVTNPDAEGRLVLADALGLAHKYKPDLIIDIATLTGAASKINCWSRGYYYAQPPQLRSDIEVMCERIGERMLPMPHWPEYREVLKSPVADIANSPLSCSDSFVAALFLKEFVPKNCPWVHIDLAHDVERHIATGVGLRTIVGIVRQLT